MIPGGMPDPSSAPDSQFAGGPGGMHVAARRRVMQAEMMGDERALGSEDDGGWGGSADLIADDRG